MSTAGKAKPSQGPEGPTPRGMSEAPRAIRRGPPPRGTSEADTSLVLVAAPVQGGRGAKPMRGWEMSAAGEAQQ